MGFTRPSDLVAIMSIFLLVIITIGFGIQSAQDYQNTTISTTYFSDISNDVGSLKNTSNTMTDSLKSQTGQQDSTNTDNIILRSVNSVLSIGRTFTTVEHAVEQTGTELGINNAYWTIVIAFIVVVFAVVTYTWFRGQGVL